MRVRPITSSGHGARTTSAAVAAGLALTLATAAGCTSNNGSDLQTPGQDVEQPQRWEGTIHATKTRSHPWLDAGYRARGDFWFTVAEDGTVTGHAAVAYEPIVDLSGANDILGYAQSVGAATLGAIPLPVGSGVLASVAVDGLLGFSYTTPNPQPTQEGTITGSLRKGELSLDWDDAEPLDIPVEFYTNYVDGDEPLTEDSFPVDSPWPGAAEVREQEETPHAVAQADDQEADGDVTESTSTYWGAHRTTPG